MKMKSMSDQELMPETSIDLLFADIMLSSPQPIPVEEKLKFLSRLHILLDSSPSKTKKMLEGRFRNKENELYLVTFLNVCLTTEPVDRYILYSARKVVAALLKMHQLQAGTDMLMDLLNPDHPQHLLCAALQICNDLFSSKNSNLEFFDSNFASTVVKSWKITMERTSCVSNNQCLYEYFSLFLKVAKTCCSSTTHKDKTLFMQQILNPSEELTKILFDEGAVHEYVKKKLIQFLCFILKPCNMLILEDTDNGETIRVSISIFNKLWSCNVHRALSRDGQTTFAGTYGIEKAALCSTVKYNTVHIREWTFLCLCVCSIIVELNDSKERVVVFLSRVDDCVKELVDQPTSDVFPWLPEIYADQDDRWIDAMLLLMDIFSVHVSESTCMEAKDQHHIHFLQFAGTLGYDHLVFIDLLTSPETNFLTYLLKYLKYLLKTWKKFQAVAQTYSQKTSCFICDDTSVEPGVDMADTATDTTAGHRADMIKCHNDIDKDASVIVDNYCANGNNTSKTHREAEEVEKYKHTLVDTAVLGCVLNQDQSSHVNVLASSSLAMIAHAYEEKECEDDDDDKQEDDDNVEEKETCNKVTSRPVIDDTNSPVLHNVPSPFSFCNIQANSSLSTETAEVWQTDKFKCCCENNANCLVSTEIQQYDKSITVHRTENELNEIDRVRNSSSGTECKELDKDENDASDINGILDTDRNEASDIDDKLDTDRNDPNEIKAALYTDITDASDIDDILDSDGNEVSEFDPVFDKVMGMLIRTRLKLEKLSESSLIHYNPMALNRLISSVEMLYEGD